MSTDLGSRAPAAGRPVTPPSPALDEPELERPERALDRLARLRTEPFAPGTGRPIGWLLAAVVAFNLWYLRSGLASIHDLNDGSFHAAYVRWAAARIQSGRSPFDGLFTQLGLGFPVFHHYQVLPHVVVGAAGAVDQSGHGLPWASTSSSPCGPARLRLEPVARSFPRRGHRRGRRRSLRHRRARLRLRAGQLHMGWLRHVEPAVGHVAVPVRGRPGVAGHRPAPLARSGRPRWPPPPSRATPSPAISS